MTDPLAFFIWDLEIYDLPDLFIGSDLDYSSDIDDTDLEDFFIQTAQIFSSLRIKLLRQSLMTQIPIQSLRIQILLIPTLSLMLLMVLPFFHLDRSPIYKP